MRIVRYPLEIVDYQQLQPLWPGRVLSVAPGRPELVPGRLDTPRPALPQKIDMWCIDNEDKRRGLPAPVLGVWIVGTGNPIDPDMFNADALFHGTCVMGDGLVWHVWTAVVGEAEQVEQPAARPEYGSVDDLLESIKVRHAGRKQQ